RSDRDWSSDVCSSDLVASAGALALYHALMTNEVMGYHARFYAPALLPLGLAAALAWPDFRARERRWATVLFVLFHALATIVLHADRKSVVLGKMNDWG